MSSISEKYYQEPRIGQLGSARIADMPPRHDRVPLATSPDCADRGGGRIGRKTCHRPTLAAHHRPTRRLWSAEATTLCRPRLDEQPDRCFWRSSPEIPLVAEKHNVVHRIGIQRPKSIATEWHRVASPAHSVFRKQETMEQYVDEFATATRGGQHLLAGGTVASAAAVAGVGTAHRDRGPPDAW
jgi:hypothetical protein